MNKKNFLKAILVVVVLGLVLYVLKDVDFNEVWELLLNIKIGFFFLGALCFGIGMLFWVLRFKYVSGIRDFWFVFKIILGGCFINTITPGSSIGGEPMRIYYIMKRTKKRISEALGIMFADKFFHFIVFFGLSILSVLFLFAFVSIPYRLKIILMVILACVFALIGVIGFFFIKRKHINFDWIAGKIYKIKSLQRFFKDDRDFKKKVAEHKKEVVRYFDKCLEKNAVKGILLSFAFWMFLSLCSFFLFLSFSYEVNFISVVIVVILSFLVGTLSPSPGGIGLMEGVMFLLYSAMGISGSVAVSVALLNRVIYYFYNLGIGGLCIIGLHKINGWKRFLRSLEIK